MPSGIAVASSGAMSLRPSTSRPMSNEGTENATSRAAATTSGTDIEPPIQAIAVPTSSATSPTGRFPGSRTSVKKPTRMITITGSAIHSASHICAAGRMEMNAIEIPASVPSSAACGVYRRMTGPMNAPSSTMRPMMNDHAIPAVQAMTGFPVASAIGSMITKTTMNMCGTLGP
jgi:hypothetical protein